MLREIRRVLPSRFIVGSAFVTYGTVKLVEALIRYSFGIDPNNIPRLDGRTGISFHVFTLLVLGGSAFGYGCYRAVLCHPGLNKKFTAFLRSTPWQSTKRLPWGGPTLCMADSVVLGVIATLAAFEVPDGSSFLSSMTIIVAAFAFGYAACPIYSHHAKAGGSYTRALLVLLPLIVFAATSTWMLLLFAAVILPLAHLAIHESLKSLPLWELDEAKTKQLGWPFDLLPPRDKSVWISAADAWALAIWLGWLTAIVIVAVRIYAGPILVPKYCAIGVYCTGLVVAVVRLMAFLFDGMTLPLLSRFKTGRWIIPDTDIMFVPSLVVVAITLVSANAIELGVVSAELLIPPFVIAVLASALTIGPKPIEWQLTCEGSMRPVGGVKFKKQPTPAA